MYSVRELRLNNGAVDPFSPGSNGRFTAKAKLNAYFGDHLDFAEDTVAGTPENKNMIHGTITEFKDGDTDLGFEVTLDRAAISTTGIAPGMVTMATIGGSGPGAGTWEADFYGVNPTLADADDDPDDFTELTNSTLPSGVAGQFDVSATNSGDGVYGSRIVGAFAAEKQ